MATRNIARRTDTPAQITAAGMAADLYGCADERPPLVLLPGLTFDRRIWQPVLDHLARIDPGRQVLSLDLPGHGESPDQLPHSMQHITGLIHQAVEEAGLDTPVVVGHSMAGGLRQHLRGPAPHSRRHQHRRPAGSRDAHASCDRWRDRSAATGSPACGR